jgi:GNAT superfamily N-acetyltransferase
VTVRRAGAADAAAIAVLLAELGYGTAAADVERRLAGTAALVAELDGEIAGVLTLSVVPVLHEPGDWCRITMLVVAARARRRGLARALVAEAEAVARGHGCMRIEVTSAFHRDGAHEFYRGMGYGQVSEHFLKPLAASGG